MKSRIPLIAFLFSVAAGAQASNGYVFVAPGGVTSSYSTQSTLQLGFGFNIGIWKGLGASLEVGGLGPTNYFTEGVMGVISPGATYYFRSGDNKIEPFASGGYSLFFRNGHENLGYFAAGTDYWLARRVGVRFEFRDHVHGGNSSLHFWGLRFGMAFR